MQLLEDSGHARPGICSEHNQWCTVQQSLSTDEQDHCLSSPLFQASIISREINSSVAAGDCTGVAAIQLVTSNWIEKSVSCQLGRETSAIDVRQTWCWRWACPRHAQEHLHSWCPWHLQVQWHRLPPKNENLWVSCSATCCAPWKITQKLYPPLVSICLTWSS